MIRAILILLTTISFFPSEILSQSYRDKVLMHRSQTDEEFSDTARTILTAEQLASFHGLQYFDVDENYSVKAKFKAIKNAEIVQLKTSGTRTPSYRPYGVLHFKLNGKKCKLTLYQMADPARPELNNHLMLAFSDKTNGFTTYGGGRYLDFTTEDVGDHMIIDFNYCYNPYCAYVDRFSCVIPPAENSLPIPINAGVKKFHD